MQLDFIENINVYGDNLVRLYDFDSLQAAKFLEILKHSLIINRKQLELSTINFIESRNCYLTLRISEEDFGIVTEDAVNFYCDMTTEGYKQMINLIEPFCKRDTKSHKLLYDVDSLTDFLFSPAGSWEDEEEEN